MKKVSDKLTKSYKKVKKHYKTTEKIQKEIKEKYGLK